MTHQWHFLYAKLYTDFKQHNKPNYNRETPGELIKFRLYFQILFSVAPI